MTHRSPLSVIGFSFLTAGIYWVYWLFKTTDEMNAKGAEVPTAWLSLVPFVNLWWLYRWCAGVEHVTRGSWTATSAFLVSLLLPCLGPGFIQGGFNKAPSARGGVGGQVRVAA